jgi:hypothetical protein
MGADSRLSRLQSSHTPRLLAAVMEMEDDLDAELADFLAALRAADMPTLLAIREAIRQVR